MTKQLPKINNLLWHILYQIKFEQVPKINIYFAYTLQNKILTKSMEQMMTISTNGTEGTISKIHHVGLLMFPMTTYSGQDLSRAQATDNLLLYLCLIAYCADRISQMAINLCDLWEFSSLFFLYLKI